MVPTINLVSRWKEIATAEVERGIAGLERFVGSENVVFSRTTGCRQGERKKK